MKHMIALALILSLSSISTSAFAHTDPKKAAAEKAEADRQAAAAAQAATEKAEADKAAAAKLAADKAEYELNQPYDIQLIKTVHIICTTRRIANKLSPIILRLLKGLYNDDSLHAEVNDTGMIYLTNYTSKAEYWLPAAAFGCSLFKVPKEGY